MLTRACLVGLGASLLLAASAAAAEPDIPDAAGAAAAVLRDPLSRLDRAGSTPPRLRWGIPVSPFPELEAERKIFGFHLEFEFGRSEAPRRGYRLR